LYTIRLAPAAAPGLGVRPTTIRSRLAASCVSGYADRDGPENVVTILAVGVKDRNRVLIGGEEIEL